MKKLKSAIIKLEDKNLSSNSIANDSFNKLKKNNKTNKKLSVITTSSTNLKEKYSIRSNKASKIDVLENIKSNKSNLRFNSEISDIVSNNYLSGKKLGVLPNKLQSKKAEQSNNYDNINSFQKSILAKFNIKFSYKEVKIRNI